jgi:NAD(P)-dependent dehydrogenase (short-subunit alcohol dehydrogenase family)
MRKSKMMMKNENVVIHGDGGAVAGAAARAFARGGTKVLPAGCRLASAHNKVAKDILFVGGVAEAPAVDALDEQAVEAQV